MRFGALLAVATVFTAAPIAGQTLRDFTARRPLRSESRLALHLQLYEGIWRVSRASGAELYAVTLAHDPDRFAPVAGTARDGALQIGLRGESHAGFRLKPPSRLVQEGELRLSPEVEWDLRLDLGSSEADLDLSGIGVSELVLDAAASRTTLRFPEANQTLCRRAAITVGAGELFLDRFGNSGCRELRVDGRLGRLVLDFSGQLPGDVTGVLDLAAGTLVLRVPAGVGLRLTTDGILSRVKGTGLLHRGDTYVSNSYAESRRKVNLQLSSLLGFVSVEWVR